MKLVKCLHCDIFVVYDKSDFRRHEAKHHAYQPFKHEPHHHKPLTDNEKTIIVARGEQRLGLHHFIGYGATVPDASTDATITGPVSL